jgi:hypothetical protein
MATGALEVPYLDSKHQQRVVTSDYWGPLPVRGTCGVTFISPHYAITASHCLTDDNAYDPAAQTFTVRTFDITEADLGRLFFDSNLSGEFPNFDTIGTLMDHEPGYHAYSHPCHIRARCAYDGGSGPSASDYNCGFVADVTLLYCEERSNEAPWLNVATDTGSGPVEMYWFHEIVNAPAEAGSTDPTDISLWNYYTNLAIDRSKNWHYLAAPTNVLVPVMSIPWSGGTPRTRLGADINGMWTDLFGCHGTSGSGVLQRNSSGDLELLGPVHAGSDWARDQLCNEVTAAEGERSVSYESNASVRKLTELFSRQLLIDRIGDPIGR